MSKELVRSWLQQRQQEHKPPPPREEVRRALGWALLPGNKQPVPTR